MNKEQRNTLSKRDLSIDEYAKIAIWVLALSRRIFLLLESLLRNLQDLG